MLTSIHIQGFKGFRDTKIPELRRVNLIVGGQNSGKTSLLEAVYAGPDFSSATASFATSLSNELVNAVQQLGVTKKSLANKIEESKFRHQPSTRANDWIKNALSNKPSIELIPPSPFTKACFTVYPIEEIELVKLYDVAVENKTKKRWIELLNLIEPRLESLESITVKNEKQPSVNAELTDIPKLMPLSMLGQGFNRLAYLYAGLLGQNANIALIDEIENGIHHSVLSILWEGIANIAKELDIQIFATTHSYECVRAAAQTFVETPDDFQVIRLERTEDGNIEAISIPFNRVKFALENDWEIR